MPDPALPQARPAAMPGTVRYRHEYRDALGRPMTGTATITGTSGARADRVTVPVVEVRAEIVGGVLAVDLLPDRYTITAALRTADGARITDRHDIDLEAQ